MVWWVAPAIEGGKKFVDWSEGLNDKAAAQQASENAKLFGSPAAAKPGVPQFTPMPERTPLIEQEYRPPESVVAPMVQPTWRPELVSEEDESGAYQPYDPYAGY